MSYYNVYISHLLKLAILYCNNYIILDFKIIILNGAILTDISLIVFKYNIYFALYKLPKLFNFTFYLFF